MEKPILYSEWIKEAGKGDTLGVKALIADKAWMSTIDVKNHVAQSMSHAIAEKMRESGQRPFKGELSIDHDPTYRASETTVIMDVFQGDSPTEYIGMAHEAWQANYEELIRWENKSLWQYLRYWIIKTWRRYARKTA